jgi:hypothetical protein
MAGVIKGSRHVSQVAGREHEIPALMWAGAILVAVGASMTSGWQMSALNQLLPQRLREPGSMDAGASVVWQLVCCSLRA